MQPPNLVRNVVISPIAFLILGGFVGFLSWGEFRNPALALIVPFVWILLADPTKASAWILGYYLLSLRGAQSASAVFFGESSESFAYGIALWTAMSVLVASPWIFGAYLCRRRAELAGVVAVGAMVIAIIPPLGIIGGASPLLSLGWIAPGAGWFALCAYLAVILLFPLLPYRKWLLPALIGLCVPFIRHIPEDHSTYSDIKAVSTKWGRVSTVDNVVERIGLIADRAKQEANAGAKAVIFPESILGDWTDSYKKPWKWGITSVSKSAGIQIGIGTNRQIGRDQWDNTLVLQDGNSATSVGARQTIPVSMYQPWHDAGYLTDWNRSANIRVAGHEAMVLFCYEEHLPGIILSGILRNRPEVIIAISNSWWGKGGAAPIVQERHSESLARLFGIPLLRAENT